MRKGFLRSKQPLSRAEMDNRLSMNRTEQYWHDVSTAFSNPDNVVDIYVSNAGVFTYLQKELDTTYRRAVMAGECMKQYESLRASYESSQALADYRASGQGNPNFFPGFCRDNPVHVYLHYIMREDKERSGNDDLSIAAFSLIDPKKHMNSMSMPAGAMTSTTTTTHDNDEDMPSSDNQPPKRTTRQSFMDRLNSTLDTLMKDYSPVKRRRDRPSIMDLLDKKVRAKKLRLQLKEMQEQDR